jgi:hypothetical protein
MQKIIVNVMGYSGAGKDTYSSALVDQLTRRGIDSTILKWSAPMKYMLAWVYDIEMTQLEDKAFRLQELPHLPGVTWGELMVRTFEYFPQVDPLMMQQKVSKQIDEAWDNGQVVILNDTRNRPEAEYLKRQVKENNVTLINIWLFQGTEKASDVHSLDLSSELDGYSKLSLAYTIGDRLARDYQATLPLVHMLAADVARAIGEYLC